MCSLHRGTFFYNTDNDTVDLSGEIDQFLYLDPQPKSLSSNSWAVTSMSTYSFSQLNGTFMIFSLPY